MKFIDQEDTKKLYNIGSKIQQMKLLNQDIHDFFIKNDEPLYESAQDILDVIKLYVKGEDYDYIGDTVFQSDGEPVMKLLNLFRITTKNI